MNVNIQDINYVPNWFPVNYARNEHVYLPDILNFATLETARITMNFLLGRMRSRGEISNGADPDLTLIVNNYYSEIAESTEHSKRMQFAQTWFNNSTPMKHTNSFKLLRVMLGQNNNTEPMVISEMESRLDSSFFGPIAARNSQFKQIFRVLLHTYTVLYDHLLRSDGHFTPKYRYHSLFMPPHTYAAVSGIFNSQDHSETDVYAVTIPYLLLGNGAVSNLSNIVLLHSNLLSSTEAVTKMWGLTNVKKHFKTLSAWRTSVELDESADAVNAQTSLTLTAALAGLYPSEITLVNLPTSTRSEFISVHARGAYTGWTTDLALPVYIPRPNAALVRVHKLFPKLSIERNNSWLLNYSKSPMQVIQNAIALDALHQPSMDFDLYKSILRKVFRTVTESQVNGAFDNLHESDSFPSGMSKAFPVLRRPDRTLLSRFPIKKTVTKLTLLDCHRNLPTSFLNSVCTIFQ